MKAESKLNGVRDMTPKQRELVELLVKYPTATFKELAERLGVSTGAIQGRLLWLIKDGIVSRKPARWKVDKKKTR